MKCCVQVGNFRVEPPGLFRGRGDHPKMGKLKARIYPRDITINIGAASGCTALLDPRATATKPSGIALMPNTSL